MNVRYPVATVVLWLLAIGCSVPPGLKYQVSGLQVAPLGNAPQAPKITFGMQSASVPDPVNAGPGINRVQIKGFGLDHTATITHGPVGDELRKAGPAGVELAKRLHDPSQ